MHGAAIGAEKGACSEKVMGEFVVGHDMAVDRFGLVVKTEHTAVGARNA